MAVVLGPNQYGKAEVRLVRIVRDTPVHQIKDVNVSIALSGDLDDTHYTGGNQNVLPTDTTKNTVYAFAREAPVGEIEEFGLRLARHFVTLPSIHRARITVEEFGWERITAGGRPHDHSFQRVSGTRTTRVQVLEDGTTTIVSGVEDLVVLKSTGSEFTGYVVDRYTTLRPTTDRILSTAVRAHWRFAETEGVDFAKSHEEAREALLEAFAETHSLSLQQTLHRMGRRVLETRPELCEVRLSLPNKHHFLVDLSPFGLDNPNEVFHAADRPYGLIEGVVLRDDAPAETAGIDWGF